MGWSYRSKGKNLLPALGVLAVTALIGLGTFLATGAGSAAAPSAEPSASTSAVPDAAAGGEPLPREVIQRIIQQHRACHERALSRQPALNGRVEVRFVIRPGGTVREASDGGSDLPDREVVDCVDATGNNRSDPRDAATWRSIWQPLGYNLALHRRVGGDVHIGGKGGTGANTRPGGAPDRTRDAGDECMARGASFAEQEERCTCDEVFSPLRGDTADNLGFRCCWYPG